MKRIKALLFFTFLYLLSVYIGLFFLIPAIDYSLEWWGRFFNP